MTRQSQNGFTLVELAIVLMIIGLLIAGVLRGQELLENAQVTATIQQAKSYQAAMQSFRSSYGALAGDMATATSRIPGCTAAANCANGNGNNMIGTMVTSPWVNITPAISTEYTQFWKHLALANLISGVNPAATTPEWGQSHPTSKLGGGFFIRYSSYTSFEVPPSVITSHFLVTRRSISGEWDCGNIGQYRGSCTISPMRAANIDRKVDDGVANNGDILAISASWTTGCGRSNVNGQGRNGYNETSNDRTCDLMIQIR